MGIVIETKKSPFHTDETVYTKVVRLCGNSPQNIFANIENLKNQLQSKIIKVFFIILELRVNTFYTGRQRTFYIKSISYSDAERKQFDNTEGERVSVQKYLKDKYGITLT